MTQDAGTAERKEQIYIPRRFRVRFNAGFKSEPPSQVEVHFLPTGVFGIQDGRTPRRDEETRLFFDQKTGESVVGGLTGEPITLEAVSLENISIGIGRPASLIGNRLMWTPMETVADANTMMKVIETQIHSLVGILPVLSYRRDAPISIAAIFVEQDEQVVGWAELITVNVILRPYKREIIEEELRGLESWLRAHTMNTARWWAMVYYSQAMGHLHMAPVLNDSYAEIIINLWKAAEALLGTWKIKKVETAAKSLGLDDGIAKELRWLCELRHSGDVAHAVIHLKKSPDHLEALYGEREEKMRRARNVVRTLIDHALNQ
jgi:hypothetical protein